MTYVGEALETFSGIDDLEAIGDALVHLGVSLQQKSVREWALPVYGT